MLWAPCRALTRFSIVHLDPVHRYRRVRAAGVRRQNIQRVTRSRLVSIGVVLHQLLDVLGLIHKAINQ